MNPTRLQKLQEMEAAQPQDAFLKFAIAQEYMSGEQYAEALKYYTILITDFPDYVPTYYQLGKLYETTNEIEKAVSTYKTGVEKAQAVNDLKTVNELRVALWEVE